jgi:3-methyladenine DNA glycosylase AlkD
MASKDSAVVIERLKSLANPANVAGMARYGISPQNALGISTPTLRKLAKEIGKNHLLALELWESGIHEARSLACLVDDPGLVTEEQIEKWVRETDSWDICDGCCLNLFVKLPYAYDKVREWSASPREFTKRAAFSLIACLAVNDKKAPDPVFLELLPIIKREATDERNFVRKSVNWALRQIGKRDLALNAAAIATARQIGVIPSKTARWVANDALRELKSEEVQARLKEKEKKRS